MKIILLIVLMLVHSSVWGVTYFLRADGTAANKAIATSCSAASTAMSTAIHNGEIFSVGDVVYICSEGGTITASIVPPSDGVRYTGNDPTITVTGQAINIGGKSGLTFDNLTITGGSSNGFFINPTTSTISGLTITQCVITSNGSQGIQYFSSTNNDLHDVNISDNVIASNGGHGIQMVWGNDGSTGIMYNASITDNHIHSQTGVARMGMRVGQTGGSIPKGGNVNISGNEVYNNGGGGMTISALTDTGGTSIISGNTVYSNGSGGSLGGIWTGTSTNIIVEKNTVYNNTTNGIDGVGIYSDNGNVDCIIRNNIVHGHTGNSTSGNTQSAGIGVTGGASSLNTGTSIYNNVVYDNFSGIRMSGSNASGVSIYNNTIVNNTAEQIRAQTVIQDSTIENCILYGGTYGIWAQAGTTQPTHNYNLFFGNSLNTITDEDDGAWSLSSESITSDPLFKNNTGNYDFHLQSTSLAIDSGDPSYSASNEPENNGDRINMGAYGNTTEAAVGNDTDGDGLTDQNEQCYDSDCGNYDPYNSITNPSGTDLDFSSTDTDFDGYLDSNELMYGSDPINELSFPSIVPDGDVNLDGQVNVADILLAQRYVLGLGTLSQGQIDHGDVYPTGGGDGLITVSDVLLISRQVFQ